MGILAGHEGVMALSIIVSMISAGWLMQHFQFIPSRHRFAIGDIVTSDGLLNDPTGEEKDRSYRGGIYEVVGVDLQYLHVIHLFDTTFNNRDVVMSCDTTRHKLRRLDPESSYVTSAATAFEARTRRYASMR